MNSIAAGSLRKTALLTTVFGISSLLPFGLTTAYAAAPSLSVTAPVNIPGANATIAGSGFAPGETVHISFGAQSVHLSADGGGNFSTSLPIPVVPASLQFASGFGESSGTWALGYIWIAGFNPLVAPSGWFLPPGAPLSFSGTGFGPNETVTAVYASTTLAAYTTDASGSFSGQATSLPVSLANTTATIAFHGASSNASTSVTLTIGQLYPVISPSSWYVNAGSTISLSGTGFAPNEPIAIVAGSVTASSTTDGTGAFTLPALTLPTHGGPLAITATGGNSGAVATANITLAAPTPWLTFSSYWAVGGSPLTIFGNNFLPNEAVTLSSGAGSIGTTTADGSGNFSFATIFPYAPAGPITIAGTGATSGATANGSITDGQVYTDLQLASYAGAPGTPIEFIGHGYLPNEQVQITTDRTGSTTVATFTADAGGSFDSTYTPPADFAPGLLDLTVTGLHSFATKDILYYLTGG